MKKARKARKRKARKRWQTIVKGKAFEYPVYYVVWLVFFFFLNIVMPWKIIGVSKASVLYIYIDNKGYISKLILKLSLHFILAL